MRAIFSLPTLVATKNVVMGPKFLDAFIPHWPRWANMTIMTLAYSTLVITTPAYIFSSLFGIDFMSAFMLSLGVFIFHLEVHFAPPGFTHIHRPGTETVVWDGIGRGWSTYSWMDFPDGAYRPAYRFIRAIWTQLSELLALSMIGLIIRIWLEGANIQGGTSPAGLIREGLVVVPDLLYCFILTVGAFLCVVRVLARRRLGRWKF